MKATDKAPALEHFLYSLTGSNRVECIERGWCVTCDQEGIPAHDAYPGDGGYWRDALSLAEYKISGMCQLCQDDIFSEDSEE